MERELIIWKFLKGGNVVDEEGVCFSSFYADVGGNDACISGMSIRTGKETRRAREKRSCGSWHSGACTGSWHSGARTGSCCTGTSCARTCREVIAVLQKL